MRVFWYSFIQFLCVVLLMVSLAGCSPVAVPADAPSSAPSLPAEASVQASLNDAPNSLSADIQNLEPIDASNIQHLHLLARYSEGGLADELALSPDGKLMAVAAAGGVVLYDALTAERMNFFSTDSAVTSLAFSPYGQKLAYFSRIPGGEKYSLDDPDFPGQEILKPQLTLRSMPDGALIYSQPLFGRGCGEYSAGNVTFSPDGRQIYFEDFFGHSGLSKTGSLCILDAQNGNLLSTVKPEAPWMLQHFTPLFPDEKNIWTLNVDDSGAQANGSTLNQLRQYNFQTGSFETEVNLQEAGALALSPDSQWLVTGTKTAQIRSAADGSLAAEIRAAADDDPFSAASFSPDSKTLALGAWDGSVSLYGVPQGQALSRIEPVILTSTLAKNEPLHVVDLHYSVDGSILYMLLNSYFVDTPELVRGVRLSDGQEVFRISGRNTVDRRPSLSPDHTLLAWGGYEDGSVQVWSTVSREQVYTLKGHTQVVRQTLFSPDGRQLATASTDGTVRLWNAADGTPLAVLDAHEGGVWGIGYSPDGSQLASVGKDGLLKLWNSTDGSLLKTLGAGTSELQVNSVSFSPDSRAVLVTSGSLYPLNSLANGAGDLRSIDLGSGQISILLSQSVIDLSFSADREKFGIFDGNVQFGQIVSGQYQIQSSFISPFGNGQVYGAAISPDGSLFLSGNTFGIHIWDTANRQMIGLAQDRSRAGNYGAMQFTADGCILVVADGVIYLWGISK